MINTVTYSTKYYSKIATILPLANGPNPRLRCDYRPKTKTVFLFSSIVWLVQTICIVLHAQSSIGPNASANAAGGLRLSWGLGLVPTLPPQFHRLAL